MRESRWGLWFAVCPALVVAIACTGAVLSVVAAQQGYTIATSMYGGVAFFLAVFSVVIYQISRDPPLSFTEDLERLLVACDFGSAGKSQLQRLADTMLIDLAVALEMHNRVHGKKPIMMRPVAPEEARMRYLFDQLKLFGLADAGYGRYFEEAKKFIDAQTKGAAV